MNLTNIELEITHTAWDKHTAAKEWGITPKWAAELMRSMGCRFYKIDDFGVTHLLVPVGTAKPTREYKRKKR